MTEGEGEGGHRRPGPTHIGPRFVVPGTRVDPPRHRAPIWPDRGDDGFESEEVDVLTETVDGWADQETPEDV